MNIEQLKYSLPNNWEVTLINEIVTYSKGRKPYILRKQKFSNSVPYLDIRALEKEVSEYADTDTSLIINESDIVMVWDGSRSGLVLQSRQQGALGSTLAKINVFSLNASFLYYFLLSKFEYINNNLKGIGVPHVNSQILGSITIPLPPLNEQHRIVEKIEELFSEIEHAEKNLSDIQKRLGICWQWELKSTYTSINEKIKLGNITEIIMGQSPAGSTYNNKGIGIPLINGPMEFGKSSFSKTILSKWTTKPTKICNEGDIIICVRGSTTGRLNIAGFNACIGRGVAAIQPHSHVYRDYLLYYLHYIEKDMLEMGTGTTFPSISKEQLNEVIIPLCSYGMQMEFANNLDSKYTIIENAKKEIEKIFKQIEILKQTIFYKAFTGELVPQNPEDEPA